MYIRRRRVSTAVYTWGQSPSDQITVTTPPTRRRNSGGSEDEARYGIPPSSASRGKSDTTLQRFAIEKLPRHGPIMDYNELQLVVRCQHSENGRPAHPGTTRSNPLLRNHRVIIGCRTFHDFLMELNLSLCPNSSADRCLKLWIRLALKIEAISMEFTRFNRSAYLFNVQ